jgi:VanZ family protein
MLRRLGELFQIAAWFLLTSIVILSLVPAQLRPTTGLSQTFEHFLLFSTTGVAFAAGYSGRLSWRMIALGLAIFVAGLELAQLLVPGRHARLSDFIMNAVASCIGVAIVFAVAWTRDRIARIRAGQSIHWGS